MALFEEVLPALRAGKKVRRLAWNGESYWHYDGSEFWTEAGEEAGLYRFHLDAHDWEVVPEPKRVADYWVPFAVRSPHERAYKKTHEIGKQPEGSVLIPGSERTVEGKQ